MNPEQPTRSQRCPGCSKLIVFEDATCTIRHQAPQCAWFASNMARLGMKARREPWTALVQPDGSAAIIGNHDDDAQPTGSKN